MKSLKLFKPCFFGAVMTVGLLSGCQGEDSASSGVTLPGHDHSNDTVTYAAQDTVRETTLSDHYYVDLQQNMSASNGQAAYLKAVSPLSNDDECRVLTTTPTGFTVSADMAKVCYYTYTVGGDNKAAKVVMPQSRSTVNADGSGTGTVSVLAGSKTEKLPPLSAVVAKDASVVVNPKDLLGAYGIDTAGYNVSDPEVATATRTGSTVSTDGTTITYTPGAGVTGFERVMYSLSDGSNVKAGTVDIAVSAEANNAPTAEDFEYLHEGKYSVDNGVDELIDVKPYIHDKDSDTLQLVEVRAYDMDFAPLSDDQDNTEFTFNSNEPGLHYITYVVTDHKGGYASGVISLTVRDVYGMVFVQVGAESNDGDDLYFAPPYTANQAEEAGVKYIPSEPGDGLTALKGLRTAMHDWASGQGVCMAKGGSLPTVEQLSALYNDKDNQSGGLFVNYNWPLDHTYWAVDPGDSGKDGEYKTVNLQDGTVSNNVTKRDKHYVACLSSKAIKVEVGGPVSVNVMPNVGGNVGGADGTASYTLTAFSVDGSSEVLYPDFVNWTMEVSDPYFIETNTVELHPENGSFDYHPDNNTFVVDGDVKGKAGQVTIEGCDKDKVCNTMITELQIRTIAGPFIDIFDRTNGDGTGILYTNSPSQAYLQSNGIENIDRAHVEEYVSEPAWGGRPQANFAAYSSGFYGGGNNWLGGERLCDEFSKMKLGGRVNWHWSTLDELKALFASAGDMREVPEHWPVTKDYMVSIGNHQTGNTTINLGNGDVHSHANWIKDGYVSCVSNN